MHQKILETARHFVIILAAGSGIYFIWENELQLATINILLVSNLLAYGFIQKGRE